MGWDQLAALTPDQWLDIGADVAITIWGSPLFRVLVFTLAVLLTIRVIAAVYSGDLQNSEHGPVGIRFHPGGRLGAEAVQVPKDLLPMNLDGVSANLRIFYVYRDSGSKRRRQEVYFKKNVRLAISPTKLPRVRTNIIFGHEPVDVATEDVCFPSFDVGVSDAGEKTPASAREYVERYGLEDKWTDDDSAPLTSLHVNTIEAIAAARDQFISKSAERLRDYRVGNFFQRQLAKGLGKRRVNVFGSYYLKLEFSRDPIFVLRKHPDRDLKMTAWLTVLTSAFAIAMELWSPNPSKEEAAKLRQMWTNMHAASLTSKPEVNR